MRGIKRRDVLGLGVVIALEGCKRGGGGGEGKGQGSARRGRGGGKGEGGPAFPVDVYPVEKKKIQYTISAPGTLDAFERVQVTARVAGGVDKVAFVEGQTVKKGDVLVVIDSARYRVAVNGASAAVEKAKANQADAEAMVQRREAAQADHPGLIPGEEIATLKTKVLTAKADRDVAIEGLRSAQLNLEDSSVKAPMDGVIQTRTVETGQYVNAGYVMATLLRSDPMLLRFQVAPLEAPRIKPGMEAEFRLRETLRIFSAKITLVAAAADPQTRLVPVTAEVQKTEHEYWLRPGSFCDVTIRVGGAREVVAIPRLAVRPSEKGFLAYVADGEVAKERVLTLGMNTADGWVEVREGLSAGDRLVLRGTEPLSDGSKVRVNEVPAPDSSALAAASGKAPPAPPPPPEEVDPRPGTDAPPATPTATAAPSGSAKR